MGEGKRMVKTVLMEKYSFNELEADFFLSHAKERIV